MEENASEVPRCIAHVPAKHFLGSGVVDFGRKKLPESCKLLWYFQWFW
jgi:hypothetical protein